MLSGASPPRQVFTWVFIIEMLLKWVAMGIRIYCQDGFNVFDMSVCLPMLTAPKLSKNKIGDYLGRSDADAKGAATRSSTSGAGSTPV